MKPFLIFFWLWMAPPTPIEGKDITSVSINDHSFSIELAITPAQQRRGLMWRTQMDDDKGMLFIFDRQQPLAFWMKNTLIPLDIIYLDKDKKIVTIIHSAIPKDTTSRPSLKPAQYVLEINGGISKKYNIKVGDVAQFR